MRIGEVAKKTGFTPDTLRWYERIGLITMDQKLRNRNNYRDYSDEVVEQLMMIKQIKSFGFSLKEVEDFLDLIKVNELNCESVEEIIDPKLELIDQKILELQNLKSKLIEAKERCSGKCIELFEAE